LHINIYKEQMLEAELLGKPVLYTDHTIPREEVPKGWYCYDLCGTDRRPGEPVKLMDETSWDHADTVLSPTPLKRETTLARPIKDRFFLTGRPLTLAEFCQERGLPQAHDPRKYIPRPASPEEAGLFYALPPERDEDLGIIGHVRMDFGRSGKEFWHTWWPKGPEELNTPEFKDELGEVVNELRRSVLKDLGSMRRFCHANGGEIEGGTRCQNHGFVVETDRYLYRLRCNPTDGDYQAYLVCADKQAQKLGLTEAGRQKLQDAADPGKSHSYRWYVLENINDPDQRMDHSLPLEEAVRLYAGLDCADKRLGVTKDGIASVDLAIKYDGREWVSEDWTKLDSFYDMPYSSLSYLCKETREADAKAFGCLIAYIREIDSQSHTVITVQVENETGLMGAAREHSDEADALFASLVPQEFADYMHANRALMHASVRAVLENGPSSGTWEQVFGELAEEIFGAFHIASYVNAVAEAGKREYAIPFAVNCWLNKPGETPGAYPSGGPISKVMEVWRYCAPNIDIIAPDIYVPNFSEMCEAYTRNGNPLYIPECAVHSRASARALLSVGRYHAMCYSPFGFEDMGQPFTNSQMALFGADVSDPDLQTPQEVERYGTINRILDSMMSALVEKYGTNELQASSAEIADIALFEMGPYQIYADFQRKDGACLVLRQSTNCFFLVVQSVALSFRSADSARPGLDILSLEEGEFVNGFWHSGRRLNGDEAVLNTYDEPAILRVRLFIYG